MPEEIGKGVVTSLSSMFPTEDAQKAVKLVEEKVEEKKVEMDRLREFIADNTSLISMVQKLPEQLHHDVMVPFGKAAFFPGQLIHTNEFLVLLGEGYYAERTCKQTVEILKRRGKDLDFQIDSLNAVIKDLKAEASFFNATASEAEEGLVEIREECEEEDEENLSEREYESGALKHGSTTFTNENMTKDEVKDEEYERIMSRLDELELLEEQELAALEKSEHEKAKLDETVGKDDENDQTTANVHQGFDQNFLDRNAIVLEDFQSPRATKQTVDKNTITEELPEKYPKQQTNGNKLNCTGLTAQPVPIDGTTRSKKTQQTTKMSNPFENAPVAAQEMSIIDALPSAKKEVTIERSEPVFDSSKAFTGSIVEHSHNLPTNAQTQSTKSSQQQGSQPTKPVSRFKMQRR